MSIGARIQEQRKKLKLTQPQLAEKLELSLNMVKKLETDRVKPSIETLEKLSDLYGCTTDYILVRTDDPEKRLTTRDYMVPIEKMYTTMKIPLPGMDDFLEKMKDVEDVPLTDEAYDAFHTIVMELVRVSKDYRRFVEKKKANRLLKEKNE